MIIKYPPLTEKEFLQKYLAITNLLLPPEKQLIPSEIDIVIEFAILPDDKFAYQRFSSLAKDRVIAAVLTQGRTLTKLNINNKLYSLIDREFLRRDEDKVIYMPKYLLTALETFRKDKTFTFNIVFNNGIDSTK